MTTPYTTKQKLIIAILILAVLILSFFLIKSELFPTSQAIKDNEAKQEQTRLAIEANTASISDNNDATVKDAVEVSKAGKKAGKRVNSPIVVRKPDSLWMEIENEENNKEL